jgi:hypothetical protein
MEFIKKSLGKWITAAIVLTIGILCIVAGAQFNNSSFDAMDTVNAISMVLGIAFIVVGSLGIILAIIGAVFAREGFAAAAMTSGTALAAGIWFVVLKTAYELIDLTISFVPYLLVVVGAIMALDALFILINALRDKNVKSALAAVIVGLVIAALTIVLGVLCINGVITAGAQLITFGVLVILYACFMVLATFVAMPKTVIIDARKSEDK